MTKVVIFPGSDPQGTGAAGRWYGVWKMDKGKPRLQGGRYIELFSMQIGSLEATLNEQRMNINQAPELISGSMFGPSSQSLQGTWGRSILGPRSTVGSGRVI